MGAYLYATVPVSYRITVSHRSADAVTNDFSGLVLEKYRRFMEMDAHLSRMQNNYFLRL